MHHAPVVEAFANVILHSLDKIELVSRDIGSTMLFSLSVLL
jgi:hypothetical protein